MNKYFESDHIFSAYDIQKWKPDPALYLNAAKQFFCKPSECIVIEDSIHGLKAAEAAGMKSFGLSYPLKPLPENIHGAEVFESMLMIKERLNQIGVLY